MKIVAALRLLEPAPDQPSQTRRWGKVGDRTVGYEEPLRTVLLYCWK